jgi:hypothetical protein
MRDVLFKQGDIVVFGYLMLEASLFSISGVPI